MLLVMHFCAHANNLTCILAAAHAQAGPVTVAQLQTRVSGRNAMPKQPIPILPAPAQQKQMRYPHGIVVNAPNASGQQCFNVQPRYRAMVPIAVVSGPCQPMPTNAIHMTSAGSQPMLTVNQAGRRQVMPVCYAQPVMHQR